MSLFPVLDIEVDPNSPSLSSLSTLTHAMGPPRNNQQTTPSNENPPSSQDAQANNHQDPSPTATNDNQNNLPAGTTGSTNGTEAQGGAVESQADNPGDNAEETVLTQARIKEIKEEKSFVSFTHPPKRFFRNFQGSYFGKVRYLNFKKMTETRKTVKADKTIDLDRMPGIFSCFQTLDSASKKDQDDNEHYPSIVKKLVVCPYCFQNPQKELEKCLLGLGRNSSSNIGQHMSRYHKEALEDSASVATDPTQQTMSSFTGSMVSKTDAKVLFQQSIYQFVNDCGFPASTVERESFRNLLKCAIANAPKLKEKDCVLSNKAITKMRLQSYNEFIKIVTDLGDKVRQAYHNLCNKAIAFCTVTHDIWQGNDKDVLGVSLIFTDPRNCEIYRLPVGLCSTKGHSAAQVAEHTKNILNAVGFTQADLSSSVNDNTNSAVLAGKYILGNNTGGKCDMHRAELILKHATGLAVRKKKGEVVDSNPKFMTIYQKFFKFAAWLMSSRAKRWDNLRAWAQKNGRVLIAIPMPNMTRVGGCMIMFHGLIRNKFVMDAYVNDTFDNKDQQFIDRYPTEEEWQALSEIEGILSPLKAVSMTLQVDDPSASAGSLLEIFSSKHFLDTMKTMGVPVLKLTGNSVRPWDAKLTIEKLKKSKPYRGILKYQELTETSRLLIDRVLAEYENYMEEGNDKHAEHAMCGHPFLASYGPNILKSIKVYDEESIKRVRKQFVTDVANKFAEPKPPPTTATSNQTDATQQQDDTVVTDDLPIEADTEPEVPDAVTDVMDCFNIFKTHRQTREQEDAALLAGTGGTDGTVVAGQQATQQRAMHFKKCDEQFGRYLEFCDTVVHNSWEDLINEYPTEAFQKFSKSWSDQDKAQFQCACRENHFHAVGKYFDVLKWWSTNRSLFPKLFPSALVWISKPATNAFQERVFSRSTFMDRNPLMRRQLDKNFEMRTMESITRKVRSEILENEKSLASFPKGDSEQKLDKTATAKSVGNSSSSPVVIDDSSERQAETTTTTITQGQSQSGTAGSQVISQVQVSPSQSESRRLETVLAAAEKHVVYELQGTVGESGIVAESDYKFRKVGEKGVVSQGTWDEVELLDLVDPKDQDQMEAMSRTVTTRNGELSKDAEGEDSYEDMIEAIEERKQEIVNESLAKKKTEEIEVVDRSSTTMKNPPVASVSGSKSQKSSSSKRSRQHSLSESVARTVVRTPSKQGKRKAAPQETPTRRTSPRTKK